MRIQNRIVESAVDLHEVPISSRIAIPGPMAYRGHVSQDRIDCFRDCSCQAEIAGSPNELAKIRHGCHITHLDQ